MNIIKGLLIGSLVSGCAFAPTADDELYIPGVAASLVQRCEDLPAPQESMNMGDLMVYTKDIMVLYIDCANKHDALVKAAGSRIKLSK